ncbi:MAG TPA: hypothetical protein VJV74_02530 [Terriglobia bacterium]|nr:hypothetical protein [Terriglobia bacterium]
MSSTRQWKRVCQAFFGSKTTGNAIMVEDLRISFEITKTIGSTPNQAKITVYNLSQSRELEIVGRIGDLDDEVLSSDIDEVIINAGYKDATQLLFRGNIKHAFRHREGNNHLMVIEAADGDKDIRQTTINVALKAGTTDDQLVDHVVSQFGTTKKGHVIVPDRKRIRGQVFSGGAPEVLNALAKQVNGQWSIQDAHLQIVPVDSTLPNEAVVMRSDTGMLSAPEISDKGVKVRCLLNPRVIVNGKVQIDNNDLKQQILKQRTRAPGAKPKKKKGTKVLARLDPDGIYKVYKVIHKGDTRGTSSGDWVTEAYCMALNKPIPAGRGVP